ncbi:MAG: 16S rRNA (guanine(527)-N(7))-methyltransferase RsmG [Bacillota bacterium]|nr:16S rRNA (guanine(527)-N(7))-methyltransferase RsmG [Bacillota bacterium]
MNQFRQYMNGVLEWNKKVNLTAIVDENEFIEKHFIDSLFCITSSEFNDAKTIIDVGTGGGFPGVPLAICYPEKRFMLMDSLAKRMKIVKELCDKIAIKNVQVIHGRAEDLGRDKAMRDKFDLCVSRAVANMSTLSEYCLPLVRPNGVFIAYKGSECEDEVGQAARAIELLGGKLDRIDQAGYNLNYNHKLVYVNKVKPTPKAYPRKAGTPSKKPL